MYPIELTEEQKREAVVEFCARGGSSEAIANRYGVSASNLYIWKISCLSQWLHHNCRLHGTL